MSYDVKITSRNYFPVVFSLALTWIVTLLGAQAKLSFPRLIITPIEEPAPTAPPGQALLNPAPYLNTLIVIGLITASGVVVLYLARKKRKLFRALIGSLIWLISFSITTIYLLDIALIIDPAIFKFWIPAAILGASLVTYALLKSGEFASSIAASYIASGAGGTIGMSIPYWTFMVLVAGISIYDVLAVYKGHLSTLTKEDAVSLKGLTIEIGDVVVGMGDLFFYSLTLAAVLWNLGLAPAIAASASMLIGYTITLRSLQKRKILPGLPIPLLTAIGSAFLVKSLI